MHPTDQRAIRAAVQAVRTMNWIVEHPLEPVPTSIIQPAMESFAAFVIDQLVEKLCFAPTLSIDEPPPEQTEPDQPDSIPEMGS